MGTGHHCPSLPPWAKGDLSSSWLPKASADGQPTGPGLQECCPQGFSPSLGSTEWAETGTQQGSARPLPRDKRIRVPHGENPLTAQVAFTEGALGRGDKGHRKDWED